jgi:AAA domain, putative AbiEii toxin, Type IV TA system
VLLGFTVANVLSLRDEQTLSLVSEGLEDTPARQTGIVADRRPVQALPVVGIYGANASGKSNVLGALRLMRQAVLESHAQWTQTDGVPRTPFALDPKASKAPSSFEIDLVIDKTRWVYGFELSDTQVEAEWLHVYPRGRRQVWFDRDAAAAESFRFPGDHLKGERATLAKLTRPNALFLSTAAAYNHPQLSVLYRWFHGNLWLVTPESDRNEREWFTSRRLLTDDRDRVLELLRVADLGIDDIEVVKQDPDPPRVRLIRSSGRRQTAFDFDDESYGTRNWFALLGPLLLTLKDGAVLLVDELDASLHTTLVAEFIRLFQDPKANPNCAQLIFTSHDTTPLGTATGNRPLGREQVWLTEKRTDGATELYPLTDAHPRKDENLERGYRAGRYGGVPRVGPGQIVRTVRYLQEVEARAGAGG